MKFSGAVEWIYSCGVGLRKQPCFNSLGLISRFVAAEMDRNG